ncbi:hypothetical protein QOZ95_003431 [Paenibacillus brasilensis]|uniref:Uncharacterized protein n=1 Tax=Paenibacillus brasilensis TaxID=128574 RepID=A0ABU0L0P1_9BACL|nr:hypothetical protein [Paenibacillus brasilensis]
MKSKKFLALIVASIMAAAIVIVPIPPGNGEISPTHHSEI